MSKTVIALYDDFETARDVVEDLVEAGFRRENISLIAPDTEGEYSRWIETQQVEDDDDVSAGEGAGFGAVVGALVGLGVALIPGIGPVVAAGPFAAAALAGLGAAAGAVTGGIVGALVDMGVPEEEAHWYAEGLRRGATMVSITTDDTAVSRAQDIMNRHNPINLERRATTWRETGWNRFETQAEPYSTSMIAQERERFGMPEDEAHFDVVEEELEVGKRQVETGGVRVRSYVTAKPVEEEIRLREEHVHVERRPVNRPATEADIDAFKEGVIEMTEHAEQPVVAKHARVIEEVVIEKDVTEHTETVRDEVRRTDVEVERMAGRENIERYETYEPRFRNTWNTRYSNRGYTYDQYRPAYRYGYTLATNPRYTNQDWNRIEPDARRYWEERNPGTWEEFKDAIHDAWMEVRGRV